MKTETTVTEAAPAPAPLVTPAKAGAQAATGTPPNIPPANPTKDGGNGDGLTFIVALLALLLAGWNTYQSFKTRQNFEAPKISVVDTDRLDVSMQADIFQNAAQDPEGALRKAEAYKQKLKDIYDDLGRDGTIIIKDSSVLYMPYGHDVTEAVARRLGVPLVNIDEMFPTPAQDTTPAQPAAPDANSAADDSSLDM